MKRVRRHAAVAVILFTSACDSNRAPVDVVATTPTPSPTPSPSPSPTPSPTPTPAPAPTAYMPFDSLSTDRNFEYVQVQYARASTNARGPLGYIRGPIQRYIAATRQWSFYEGRLIYSPSDIVQTTPDLVRYFIPRGDGNYPPEWDNSLTLYNPLFGTNRPQYVRAFRVADPITAFGQPYIAAPQINFGVLGAKTVASDALEGNLNYTLRVFGVVLTGDAYDQVFDLAGSTGRVSITPQGRITITLNLVATPLAGGPTTGFISFSSTGNVGPIEAGFTTELARTPFTTGLATGTFFGPKGRELGISFRVNVSSSTDRIAFGSAIGIQD